MAQVLLTHSYHLHYDPKQVRKMQPYPPLGTLYAAAVLRERGISVAVFDTMLQSPEHFRRALQEHRPEILVIYEDDFNFLSKMCLSRMREVAFDMIDAAVHKGIPVVVHGSDATDNPLAFLEAGASYVLCGEAELSLRELVEALLLGHEPSDIAGLVYLDPKGRMVAQPASPVAVDWRALPAPARDLIDLDVYRRAWRKAHGYFSINMVASRGCPYRCNWCAKPISGDRFHVRNAKLVADELAELKNTYSADHVWFGDDVFALDHRWTREFAMEIESRGIKVPFKIQSRADLMTRSTVDSLRRAGCREVWMGVESGSQTVLDAMDKGLDLADVFTARSLLKEAGIRAGYFLQLGYPGEGWKEIQETIDLVRRTRPDDIGVSISYPLPNTRFYESVQHQLGAKRNWRDSDDLCATFTAAYKNEFYLAIRDALHLEVKCSADYEEARRTDLAALWRKIASMERVSRNKAPTRLTRSVRTSGERVELLSIGAMTTRTGEA